MACSGYSVDFWNGFQVVAVGLIHLDLSVCPLGLYVSAHFENSYGYMTNGLMTGCKLWVSALRYWKLSKLQVIKVCKSIISAFALWQSSGKQTEGLVLIHQRPEGH